MKSKFKAHPLMILRFVRPTLFILFWPVIKGTVQYFTEKNLEGVFGLGFVLLGILFVIAFLRWQSYTLICDEKKGVVTLKYGFFFRRIAKLDISKLSSVQTTQNPLDYVFRAVTYKINTEAGIHNRTDFEFKLSIKNSKKVRRCFMVKVNQRRRSSPL